MVTRERLNGKSRFKGGHEMRYVVDSERHGYLLIAFSLAMGLLGAECESMPNEEKATLGMLYGAALTGRGIQTGNPGAVAAGEGAYRYGEHASRQAAAEKIGGAGSSEGQQEQVTLTLQEDMYCVPILKDVPEGQLANFFTFKKWVDHDGDGKIHPNEFFGVGEPIHRDDSFHIFYTQDRDKTGGLTVDGWPAAAQFVSQATPFTMMIFAPDGKEILLNNARAEGQIGKGAIHVETIPAEGTNGLLSNIGGGSYRAVVKTKDGTEVITFRLVKDD